MSSVHYHMSFRCKRDGVVNVWGLVVSKPHLVVEVTEKRTPKHRQLCEEVLMKIKTNQIRISIAKKDDGGTNDQTQDSTCGARHEYTVVGMRINTIYIYT